MLKNSKWIVVWYAAIAVAYFSALSFLGLFINELTAQSVKWEQGLTGIDASQKSPYLVLR